MDTLNFIPVRYYPWFQFRVKNQEFDFEEFKLLRNYWVLRWAGVVKPSIALVCGCDPAPSPVCLLRSINVCPGNPTAGCSSAFCERNFKEQTFSFPGTRTGGRELVSGRSWWGGVVSLGNVLSSLTRGKKKERSLKKSNRSILCTYRMEQEG